MKKILILLSFIPTLLLAQTTVSMFDFYQGGVVFHIDANGGGLIASPGDQINPLGGLGYSIYYFDWGCNGTSIATGDSLGAGAQNTINIEALCTTASTAADVCANLVIGGYSDWFLPSTHELQQMLIHKWNINNAATANGGSPFSDYGYWSSSQWTPTTAWKWDAFNGSGTGATPKTNSNRARAVRAFTAIPGCTDSNATNYNSTANFDDGSCIAVVLGCTDNTAFNYDALANTDDGSCIAIVTGCTFEFACNYNPNANTNDANSCNFPQPGYNCLGECEDNCITTECGDAIPLSNFGYEVTECTGVDVLVGNNQSSNEPFVYYIIDAGANNNYDITVGLATNEIVIYVGSGSGNSVDITYTGIVPTVSQLIGSGQGVSWNLIDNNVYGCTDPTACNYDSIANIDDGGCNYTTTSTTDVTACNSYDWNGQTYTSSSQYTWLGVNSNGCDSLATLNLTVNPSTSSTTDVTACDSYDWNGQTYTSSSQYTWLGVNSNGCDSLATLNLTINPSTSSTDTHVACDEFMWYCDGNIYTESNNAATYTYINTAGCDSVVTLDLTINNSSSNTISETACDSYVWLVDGNTYTTSGTYTDISVNSDGCDHTEILELTISSMLATISQSGDSLFAITTPAGLNANWYNIQTEDSTQRIWLMEEETNVFLPTFDCSYFIVVTDDNGCVDTSLTYNYAENAARISTLITYPNPTRGLLNVKFDNHKNQFVTLELISSNGVKLDEFVTEENYLDIDLSKYSTGIYYLYFNSENSTQGCSFEEYPQKITNKIILNR